MCTDILRPNMLTPHNKSRLLLVEDRVHGVDVVVFRISRVLENISYDGEYRLHRRGPFQPLLLRIAELPDCRRHCNILKYSKKSENKIIMTILATKNPIVLAIE